MSKVCDDEMIGCIVGAVVQLSPGMGEIDAAAVRESLRQCEGVEIHAEDAQLRLVITMEAPTSKAILKLSEAIQQMDGVLQLTPVYQHSEEDQRNEQTGGWTWR